MFQNKSMPVVGECQSNVLPFARLCNELFSPEDDTNKDKYAMIGEMAVTAAKDLISGIRDKKIHGIAFVMFWGEIMLV